jgi:phosphoenolpyruvate carboxykinase (ATP)
MKTKTSIDLSFEEKEFVILGTQYAGEMKKGIFSIMNYIMPKKGILSMHCSANEGDSGDVSLFFGLSGTGKTTLSADGDRHLIGDDEHCWTKDGVFNIEGGCYAKTIDLSEEKEPEIFKAIKFGTVLENVVYSPETHAVDYSDTSITQNTRAAYPIEFIDKIKFPCVGGHPQNIIFLTCDAFGVLPPVSKLTAEQAMYHFVSGYTAKIAGTEMGITEPVVAFSACFGAAFMVWHPSKYAELLAQNIQVHQANVWLVNTGWIGGGVEHGKRISLTHTRAIIDAIHDGSLVNEAYQTLEVFNLQIPKACNNVPSEILNPSTFWEDKTAYFESRDTLAKLFLENFLQFESDDKLNIRQYGPNIK